jgi:hypothetical protein
MDCQYPHWPPPADTRTSAAYTAEQRIIKIMERIMKTGNFFIESSPFFLKANHQRGLHLLSNNSESNYLLIKSKPQSMTVKGNWLLHFDSKSPR